jgi:hypothetical protein
MTPAQQKPNIDQELAAVKAVLTAVDQLDNATKHKVLRAAEVLLVSGSPLTPPGPRGN